MIDWVSARIPLKHAHKICGGKFITVNTNGEVEFEATRLRQVEGSYSSKIALRTLRTGEEGEIYFSGNPTKFLQGHNLYGSTDLVKLMRIALGKLCAILEITPSSSNLRDIQRGDYNLTRVDMAAMYELPTLDDVLAWIRAAAHASRSRHRSSSILRGDTLYWGKHSRRWAMKAYAKGQEITVRDHTIPMEHPKHSQLIQWAQNKLRLELTLRGPELKKLSFHSAAAFGNQDLNQIFESYRAKISLPDNFTLAPELLRSLPPSLRSTYILWQHGEDLRRTLPKNTYYRHRRQLLANGIDISVRQSDKPPIISLMSIGEISTVGLSLLSAEAF